MTSTAASHGYLRPVTLADAAQLLHWRNQPHIRKVMFTGDIIALETHVAWLEKVIASQTSHAYVYEINGEPAGYVKLDRLEDQIWDWGFYIGSPTAPRGSGSRMLFLALDEAFETFEADTVRASVKSENHPSLRVHARLNFTPAASAAQDPGSVLLELRRDDWRTGRVAVSRALFETNDPSRD